MKILILGGDGYLGWSTAMHFSQRGHEVAVLDNFLRRQMHMERGTISDVRTETGDQRRARAARLQGEVMSVALGQGLVQDNAPHPKLGSPMNPRHGDYPAT
jgi:UDP-sulfoquinovose synthase